MEKVDEKCTADNENIGEKLSETNKWHRLQGGIFLASVTGASILFGFGITIGMAKKRDPNSFAKGLISSKAVPESGGSLAMRALGRATLYSVTGFGLFCFLTWKALGVHSLLEFREKMQSIMPKIPKKEPQGRTEFSSLTDLLQYVIDESDKGKKS